MPKTEPARFTAEDRDAAARIIALLSRLVGGYDAADWFPYTPTWTITHSAASGPPSGTPGVVPLDGAATLKGAKAPEVVAAAKARPRSQPYTTAQRDRALAKMRKHVKAKHKNPAAAAAAETGLPQTTIRRWARDAGLEVAK